MNAPQGMPDLSQFDVATGANAGFDVHLLDRAGKKTGEIIRVLGRDSDKFQKKLAEHNRRRLARMQKPGMAARVSNEELEDEALELLAACTVSWTFKVGEAPFPCTVDNAIALYRQSTLVREQVDAAIGDRANFIPG